MKLLYFIYKIENSGGTERIVLSKINYLANQPGYEVYLSYFGNDKSFFPIDEKVHLLPLDDSNSSGSSTRLLRFFKLIKKVKAVIRECNPDVIVNTNTIFVNWILPFVFKKISKAIELHFSYDGFKIMAAHSDKSKFHIVTRINHVLRKTIFPMYSKCIVLTDEDVKAWGFKNCICIPNFFEAKSDIPVVHPKGHFYQKAINVGRLEHQKNQELLIDAWSIVHEKYPDWTLDIWGDGSLKEELQNQISRLNLQNIVFLKGLTDNIALEYSKADFFVMSSRYEGFGLVNLESMYRGLPNVSLTNAGVRSVIVNGENGYLIEEHTPQALADGIVRQIESLDRFEEMSVSAKKTAEKFNKDYIMLKWVSLFCELRKV